ncbi:diaminopimelate epimerase [Coralliovum pocilloporae]|uniref:diaminopimelate epimerase n=1 Tax=Coralliovum pocilloporae TaxID=3066369 RepID=UPI0033077D60
MSARHIPFRKMNGLGNTFVVFDARQEPVTLTAEERRWVADEAAGGPGFDQMITIEKPTVGGMDAFMRIHNADGGEVDACGNATRCIGWLLMQEANNSFANILTNAGFLKAIDAGEPHMVTVDMGMPRLEWQDIPLAEEFADTRVIELQIGPIDDPILHSPSAVNMGNPHAIFWVDNVEAYDLEKIGPLLEHHPIFPERANISLAQLIGENEIRLKVWERGVGQTRACGTAACAVGVAAPRKKLTDRKTVIHLPGGPLAIHWREEDDHVLMTGAIEDEYKGQLDLDARSWTKDH